MCLFYPSPKCTLYSSETFSVISSSASGFVHCDGGDDATNAAAVQAGSDGSHTFLCNHHTQSLMVRPHLSGCHILPFSPQVISV